MDKERISNFFNGLFKSELGSAAIRVLTPHKLLTVETLTDVLDTIAKQGTNRELTTKLLGHLSGKANYDLTLPEDRQVAIDFLQGQISEYRTKYNEVGVKWSYASASERAIMESEGDHVASRRDPNQHPTFRRIAALVKAINFIEGQDPDLSTQKGLF